MSSGLERWHVRADRSGCDLVWSNPGFFGKSAQLSTANDLTYGYGADPAVSTNDADHLVAADRATSAEVFRVYAGNDLPFNASLG